MKALGRGHDFSLSTKQIRSCFLAFDTNNLLLSLVRNEISPLGISLVRQFSFLGEHIKTNFGREEVKSLLIGNAFSVTTE